MKIPAKNIRKSNRSCALGYYNRLQSTARTQNHQVKVLLGLGGWTDSSNGAKYARLVSDDKAR
jgi:GH18 family chitinase